MDIVSIVIGVIGGLGLFLYGMNIMGTSLQKVAGRRLEKIVGLLTTNRFTGVLVGAFVTAVIQSSSATTVMVVGFVNAGIMQLTQAVGVIMGANIGTTVTSQIVTLSIDNLAPLLIGVGMLIWFTAKDDKRTNLGTIFIGLGILFVGMEFLKDALRPLREWEYFSTLILTLSKYQILGVLVGFGLTFIVQSSSASISILVALAASGALPLAAALPILYGDNIGTCTTALISSIGASKNAKRAAIIHLTFNIIGTILFVVFLTQPITYIVTELIGGSVPRQIANAHTIFNFANVIIQFPFAFILVKVAMWVYPDDEESNDASRFTKYIDDRLLETPGVALNSTVEEVACMSELTLESFLNVKAAFVEQSKDVKKESTKKVFALERQINKYEHILTDYLVKLSNRDISDENRSYVDGLFFCINDIERIGDHCDNLAELSLNMQEAEIEFTPQAMENLKVMFAKTQQTLEITFKVIHNPNIEDVEAVLSLEREMDDLQNEARRKHFKRLNELEISPEASVQYMETINNLERISDLAANVVRFVKDNI